MIDSTISNTSEADDEETGEELGDLDALLVSVMGEEEPAPKRGSTSKATKIIKLSEKTTFWIELN